jgi:hypothetical protein
LKDLASRSFSSTKACHQSQRNSVALKVASLQSHFHHDLQAVTTELIWMKFFFVSITFSIFSKIMYKGQRHSMRLPSNQCTVSHFRNMICKQLIMIHRQFDPDNLSKSPQESSHDSWTKAAMLLFGEVYRDQMSLAWSSHQPMHNHSEKSYFLPVNFFDDSLL